MSGRQCRNLSNSRELNQRHTTHTRSKLINIESLNFRLPKEPKSRRNPTPHNQSINHFDSKPFLTGINETFAILFAHLDVNRRLCVDPEMSNCKLSSMSLQSSNSVENCAINPLLCRPAFVVIVDCRASFLRLLSLINVPISATQPVNMRHDPEHDIDSRTFRRRMLNEQWQIKWN